MFGRLRALLQPMPAAEPLTDSEEIDRQYAYWPGRILTSLIIGYTLFYFTRKNLSMAMPAIQAELGISKAQLGIFLTLHGLLYGVSKLVNGFVGDRANPRYLMPLGLIGSAAVCVCFGMSSAIVTLGVFWTLNGWFQGMGWPPCVRSLTQWFPAKERGRRFALCNSSVSIGASLVVLLCSVLVVYNWRLCFLVPASLAALGAVFLVNRLRDSPRSLGLPSVEEYHQEITEGVAGDDDLGPGEFRRFVMEHVLLNPWAWVASLANFFLYAVRYSILDWGPMFLAESRGAQLQHAGWIIAGYEACGVIGMLLSGWIADRVFHGRASRVCLFSMAMCGVCIVLFWKTPNAPLWLSAVLLCGIGFFVYGPQSLVSVILIGVSGKRAGATAVGLAGLLAYLSGIFSGWGLGLLVDHGGWNWGFPALVLAAMASTVCFAVLWNAGLQGMAPRPKRPGVGS